MERVRLRCALLVIAVLLTFGAAPASALEMSGDPVPMVREVRPQQGEDHGDARQADDPVVLWTVAAVGVGALGFGTLYLLKRRVGGFPRNPGWVAPITIMRSSELPDDATGGDAAQGAHGRSNEH